MDAVHSLHSTFLQRLRFSCITAAVLSAVFSQPVAHSDVPQIAAKPARDGAAGQDASFVHSITLPPGIDPTALISASERGSNTQGLSLQEAIQAIAGSSISEQKPPIERPKISIAERVRAEHFYVKAREQMLAKRTFEAMQLFEAARRIDPTSPAILRQMARGQMLMGGPPAALKSYSQLLEIEPGDEEASLALAMGEVNLRRFMDAAQRIARWGGDGNDMTHDPGANTMAAYVLATCFVQLGFDRAEGEALLVVVRGLVAPGPPSMYASRLSMMRARIGQFHVRIGDAFFRAGMMENASSHWQRASESREAEPETLLRRMLLGDLVRGDGQAAGDRLVEHIASRHISEREIQLAVWLSRNMALESRERAARSIAALIQTRPGTLMEKRLAAVFLPADQATGSLTALLEDHPNDGDLIDQLFELLHKSEDARLIDVVAAMIDREPQRAIEIADHFAWVVGDDQAMVDRLEQIQGSATQKFLLSRLFHRIGAVGRAWSAAEEALAIDPAHRATLVLRVELAGALKDPERIDSSIEACKAIRDADAFLRQGRTLREAKFSMNAAEYALAATMLSPENPEAWALRAHALLDSGDDLRAASEAANRALALDPKIDEAYDVLLSLYEPNGSAPDAGHLREVGRRLRRDNPGSLLLGALTAEEFRRQSGFARSESILLRLHEIHPKANKPVEELMTTWHEMGDLRRAARWLEHALRVRPHDSRFLRQRARVFLLDGDVAGAEHFLNERLGAWPLDPVALSLKEVVLRRLGRTDEANDLARQRITRRPSGIETQMRLLWLAGSDGDEDESIRLMESLHSRMGDVPRAASKRIAATATLLEPGGESFEKKRLAMIDAHVRRFPDAPFQLYAVGLVASARLNAEENSFRAAVTHALASAGDASDMAAAQYHQIALELAEARRIDLAGILLDEALRHQVARTDSQTAALAQMAQACYIMARKRDDAVGVIDYLESKRLLAVLPIDKAAANLRAEALYALGVYCTLMSRETDATVLFTSVLELNEAHAMSGNNLGYSFIEAGDGSAPVTDMIERAHAAMPGDPNILDTIGWLRYKQQRFTEPDTNSGAGEFLLRANTQLEPEELNPEGLDHYGDAMWRLGRSDAAIEAWVSALSLAEDEAYQTRTMQGYLSFQQRVWGIVLVTPRSIFDRLHDERISTLREKIKAGREGGDPQVALTFAEAGERAEDAQLDR